MKLMHLINDKLYALILYGLSKVYLEIKFRGSTRVFSVIFGIFPLRRITLRHPLGFCWYLDSREALWTYIFSCEKFTTKIITNLADQIELGVCIGANRGWYPLVISKANPAIQLHAFEPNSSTFKLLKDNIERNITPVHLYKMAIGEFSEQKDIYSYPEVNDGMTTLYPTNHYSPRFERIEEVEVGTLDTIFEINDKFIIPTLLQIDVEGGENAVLLGAENFLKVYSPTVICEINPIMLNTAGSSPGQIFKFMSSLGYEIYWIDERGFLRLQEPRESCRHLEWLQPDSGSNYLFIKSSEGPARNTIGTFTL